MDRQITYAQAVPLETDLLNTNKNTMVALGWLAQGILGTGTLVTDVTCIANTPAALNVVVTKGQIFSLQNVDGSAYSSLGTDTTHNVLKQGLLVDNAVLTITPPGTVGFSQNYLIQAIFAETDSGSTTLPYYNPSAPATAWSGPSGSGTPQFTVRKGLLSVTAKAGVAASSGTQSTPAPDAGYVGLFVVTVANGASTISTGNISQLATAPMLGLNGQLPLIPVGVQNQSWSYVSDTGSADALVIAPVPAATAYVAGQRWSVKKNSSPNATTTPTINVSGLGAKTIIGVQGAALNAGDMQGSCVVDLVYDGTNFRMLSVVSPKGSKALFNIQTVNTSTRTTVAGSGANVYTTALSGTITKKSATSNLVVWVTNPIYYTTTGPTSIRLVVDSGTVFGLTSPATPGQSYGQTALNTIFSGLGAGTLSWTLAYARGDATAWTSTCNPNSTDQTYYPTSSTTGIVYGEIEP